MAKDRITGSIDELVREIDRLQKEIHNAGKKAFQAGDYVKTKALIEAATRIDAFKTKLKSVGEEWTKIYSPVSYHLKGIPTTHKKVGGKRIPRGKKTPESAYRIPILEALVELGGKAKTSEVLDRVYEKMKGILNDFDHEPLPSVPSQPRWRHTAQIVRNKLVKEGLMKKGERGFWEISEEGKKLVTSLKRASARESKKSQKK